LGLNKHQVEDEDDDEYEDDLVAATPLCVLCVFVVKLQSGIGSHSKNVSPKL
jgi:hypothetical protein